jgi:cyclopropane fatty-acyl-phospholipid synthase-like methyltransferase
LAAFLEVGRRAAENIVAVLAQAGFEFTPGQAVLDFGCGCGRTLRWLIQRFPEVQWHGVDVDSEAIGWCRANISAAKLVCGSPLPPLPFADGSLDMIYAISVFTHLSEDFQRVWIAELERVLRPGGVLLLSIYSERVWRAQPEAASVEAGEFVFRTSEKLKGIVPDWYHTALQSRDSVTRVLGERFARVSHQERALGDHDAVIAWKSK